MAERSQTSPVLARAVSGTRDHQAGGAPAEVSRPFWKVLPRFPRESTTLDLLRSVGAVVQSAAAQSSFFERTFPSARSFEYCQSGRECLYLILASLGLPRGARIGVPLYCCDAVFMAIGAAGFTPIFIDINLETYSIDEATLHENLSKLDALIVVHTFGYPTDIGRIQSIASGRSIPIIEDCAHSNFSEYLGKPTGSLTAAAFFTFGEHKPAAAGGGGAVVANDGDVSKRMLLTASRKKKSSAASELTYAAKRWLRGLCYTRPAYGLLLGAISPEKRELRVNKESHRAASAASELPLATHALRRVDSCLIDDRLQRFADSLSVLERNAQALRSALSETSLHFPSEPAHGKWNHFMLPVRFASAVRRGLGRAHLRRLGIDTAPLYRNCVQNASLYGYRGGCPNAEFAASTVCTVPNHEWMTGEDLGHLCSGLRSSVSAS